MPRHLKRGMDASAIKAADAKVRETVEQILADIDARKDAAVRDLSQKFDNWSPPSFKLTPAEVERAIGQVKRRDLDDIKFAQAQVRNFAAEPERRRCSDLDVETLPGVVLGHRHIPVNPGRLLCAGRALSDGRLGAYVDRHRARRRRRSTSSPARRRFRADRIRRSWRRCISAAPTRFSCLAACRRSPPWRSAPRPSRRST